MLHRISDDLGCLSAVCSCTHDAWFAPALEDTLADVERHLRLRAEFEQYLAENGDVE